jgi:phage virion morphogenesis protein
MAGVSLQSNHEQVRRALGGVAQRLTDYTPVMKLIGVHMLRSVQLNFEAGGRPVAWLPSQRVLREGGQTLRDTGQLAGSITMRADATSVRIGTNKIYARIHQFGGDIQQARRLRVRQQRGSRFAPRRALRITQRTGTVIHMPARPFLVVQPEDRTIILGLLRDYVRGGTAA